MLVEKNVEVFKNRMMTKKRCCNTEEDKNFSERPGWPWDLACNRYGLTMSVQRKLKL